MKKLFLLIALAACGDNIKPDDAGADWTDVAPEPDGVKPDDAPAPCDAGVPEPDASAPDASVPDAGCEDSHIDLNGHEHKCQHDQELPSTP